MEAYVKKTDRKRQDYYNYYADGKWGETRNYHLSVDSSLGIDTTVKLIQTLVENISGEVYHDPKNKAPIENKMRMPENKLLITMSLPMMLSMLIQALYNIVDSILYPKS